MHTSQYSRLEKPIVLCTSCDPGKTTTCILHVVPINIFTHTHVKRKSIGRKKERKKEKKTKKKAKKEGKEKKRQANKRTRQQKKERKERRIGSKEGKRQRHWAQRGYDRVHQCHWVENATRRRSQGVSYEVVGRGRKILLSEAGSESRLW